MGYYTVKSKVHILIDVLNVECHFSHSAGKWTP
jgi:hypothetical protein